MDFPYLTKVVGVNLASLANLALAPGSSQHVTMETSKLTNLSTMKWDAPNTGPILAGYYILMRETASSIWERKFFVASNTITLPYSKDNYFFGIQSVSLKGHESLPVFVT